ncbi:triacylglycerol lipase, partial [Enterococcus mundtii]
KFIYQLEIGKVNYGDKPLGTNHIVIETLDTDKDKIGNEFRPKKNSTQAMVVAEIKDEFKKLSDNDLRKVLGFPDSVITRNLTIAYAGTTSFKDWHTNLEEIGERNQRL